MVARRVEIDFLSGLVQDDDEVDVELEVTRIGGSSVTTSERLIAVSDGRVAARSETVMVHTDDDRANAAPLPEEARAAARGGRGGMTAVVHWDDLRTRDRVHTDIAASGPTSARAPAASTSGCSGCCCIPGKRSTPVHVHGAEEEIFFVLAGSGMLWQNGRTCEVGPGDCIVHLPNRERHTLRAGDDGLEVLAFGTRVPIELCYLPRAEHSWAGPTVLPSPGRIDLFPMDDAAEPLEFPPPGERPPNVVAAASVPDRRPRDGRVRRDLGTAAGSQRTGLHHVAVEPGRLTAPPHCHSAEEELFVVLEGEGHLLLGDEAHEVRRGSVVSRPPGTAVAHAFRGGHGGLELLAYGTRRAGRRLLLPALEQDLLAGRRGRRPDRARRLLGRRGALGVRVCHWGQEPRH